MLQRPRVMSVANQKQGSWVTAEDGQKRRSLAKHVTAPCFWVTVHWTNRMPTVSLPRQRRVSHCVVYAQAGYVGCVSAFCFCFFHEVNAPPTHIHTHTIPHPTLSCVVVVVDNELNTTWNPKRTISFSFLWTCKNGTVEHIQCHNVTFKSTREQNRQTETQARYNSTCFIAPTLSIEMYFLVYAL